MRPCTWAQSTADAESSITSAWPANSDQKSPTSGLSARSFGKEACKPSSIESSWARVVAYQCSLTTICVSPNVTHVTLGNALSTMDCGGANRQRAHHRQVSIGNLSSTPATHRRVSIGNVSPTHAKHRDTNLVLVVDPSSSSTGFHWKLIVDLGASSTGFHWKPVTDLGNSPAGFQWKLVIDPGMLDARFECWVTSTPLDAQNSVHHNNSLIA